MSWLRSQPQTSANLLTRYANRLKVFVERDRADRMTIAVRRALDQGYRHGQSEMVTAVLHNVRNLLNPLAMRLGQAHARGPQPATEQIGQVIRELAEASDDPERRMKLAQYVELVFQELLGHQRNEQSRRMELLRHVRQIDALLNEYNALGQATREPEYMTIEEALRDLDPLAHGFMGGGIKLRLAPEWRQIPPFQARRFQLKQVLFNLLANAREAIVESGIADGAVEVAGAVEKRSGQEFVRLTVRDNGCGIPPENLELIFQRGFSTKTSAGHGMGLHWCANSVGEMGGSLSVESAGRGKGAAFHILLPAWRPKQQ